MRPSILKESIPESEFGELIPYLQPFYEAGLDGVIVQDIGVLTQIRAHFSELALPPFYPYRHRRGKEVCRAGHIVPCFRFCSGVSIYAVRYRQGIMSGIMAGR